MSEPGNRSERRVLLGFDLRRAPEDCRADWNDERRETFLLRPSAPLILSTDTDVWPRSFSDEESEDEMAHTNSLWLWNSTSTLRGRAARILGGKTQGAWPIAITLRAADQAEFLLQRCPTGHEELDLPDCGPDEPVGIVGATFLGYDIADAWFTSFLSNCGVGKQRDLGNACDDLNDYHLVSRPSPASRLRMAADGSVTEHAPFFVFGLWRLAVPR